MPRPRYPEGSLLAAVLGEGAPPEVRRAARRLRAEGAPAVAVDGEIAGLAGGLAGSEVSRSPAVLDALPPLFWIEAGRGDGGIAGWIVERRGRGLSARGFAIGAGAEAVPEAGEAVTVAFGAVAEEGEAVRAVRGLVAAVGLPGVLAQMGESSPVALTPADPGAGEAGALRGVRLSVATSPEAVAG